MGNYMRNTKLKTRRQNPNTTNNIGGVRTRAKTLALRETLHQDNSSATEYLQLRSRRLNKLPPPPPAASAADETERNPNSEYGGGQMTSRTSRESTPQSAASDLNNVIPMTPASVTRSSKHRSVALAPQKLFQETNPTTQEIEEFFSTFESQEIRLFMDKYNFDPVNDKPLPGRFEWERVRA